MRDLPPAAKLGAIAATGILVLTLLVVGPYSWMTATDSTDPLSSVAAKAGPVTAQADTTKAMPADEKPTAEAAATLASEPSAEQAEPAIAAAPEIPPAVSDKPTAQERPIDIAALDENLAATFDNRFQAPDSQQTSAIKPDNPTVFNGVPVAETDAEILALEKVQQRENASALAALNDDDGAAASPEASEEDEKSGVMVAATVTNHVNMRSGPADEAEVLAVVPKDAAVQASAECPLQWCEVVYEGERGYIFEGLVNHAEPG